ncbi:alpha/beta hydrolase [Paraburkholderia caffeinilytica]|uniref:alpha/beta hydrolase n=1 Tax=Paraburkholderia caffeinilytica TaxID=1761016 RepID=UPI0038B6B300
MAARKPLQRIAQGLDIEDGFIERADAPIPIRTYVPRDERLLLAAFAYFHGGAFTTGDLDSHDAIACQLALQARCAVVSIDYRVMPEHRFPGAFDDAVHALRWLPGWAERLGIGEMRIAAGGDSSGANLAVAAALELGGELCLRALWLAYPFIGVDFNTPSYQENAEAPLLTRARCQRILADYAARPITDKDWRIAPLLHRDLSGLPPVVAIAGELDPLRSDAEILLERIPANAGSVLVEAEGMPHGFLRWINESEPCAAVANASFTTLRALLKA